MREGAILESALHQVCGRCLRVKGKLPLDIKDEATGQLLALPQ